MVPAASSWCNSHRTNNGSGKKEYRTDHHYTNQACHILGRLFQIFQPGLLFSGEKRLGRVITPLIGKGWLPGN